VIAPVIVNVIVAFIDAYPPDGCCFAVTVVDPIVRGVTVAPESEAIVGSAIENDQVPGEFEEGGTRAKEEIASLAIVALVKLPIVGVIALIVKVVVAVACNQLLVAIWVAVTVTTPPSNNLTIFPLTVASSGPLVIA
jgi:hypothetical protein